MEKFLAILLFAATTVGGNVKAQNIITTHAQPVTVQHSQQTSNYDEVMAWCSNWISELQSARWSAGMEAQNGNLDRAAQILLDALEQKNNEIGFPNPAPNTADAIRVGYAVASEAFNASNDDSLPQRLRAQVRYMMADSVYDLIEWAYYNLDQRFYRDVVNTCTHPGYNCYGNSGPDYGGYLPREYYDGVRQLALKLLNLQINIAPLQASDYLELKVSKAVTAGAKDILMSSVLRRSLACSINKLAFTEEQISRFLDCQDSSVPRREQVMIVRHLIAEARNILAESGCRGDYYPEQNNSPYIERRN